MTPRPPQRPRIIRLIPVLDFGGVESVFALQSELIDRTRYDFRVCTFWKKGAAARSIEALGIQVDSLEVDPSIRNPKASKRLWQYLRTHRPHVVHASIGEANFHASLVAKLAGIPAVIIEEQGLPTRALTARLVHAALYRRVDTIVAVSDSSARYVVEREFAPAKKVRRIYNCARPEFFQRQQRATRVGRPFCALLVGRLVEVKNQETLLRAFREVVRKCPDATLRIAGEGPLRDHLARVVTELELDKSVSFLGFRGDILELLLDSDLFALPSLSEGCSLALAEAMAVATPVIGSNVGGIPEVMGALGREWLVEPRDTAGWTRAMLGMIELGPEGRSTLGEHARTIAQRFSPAANIDALHSLYSDLLAGAAH